jgi:hypothetical protein
VDRADQWISTARNHGSAAVTRGVCPAPPRVGGLVSRFRKRAHFGPPPPRRSARKPRQLGISRILAGPRQAPRVWDWLALFCVHPQRFWLISSDWTRQGRDMALAGRPLP